MDEKLNDEQNDNDTSLVSSSTPFPMSISTDMGCPHASMIRLNLEKLVIELEYLREKILTITLAVERLAVGQKPETLFKFAITHFKEIVVKAESRTSSTLEEVGGWQCNCTTCQNLHSQQLAKLAEVQFIRREVVERVSAIETLAEDTTDELLTIFISRIKKVAEGIGNGSTRDPEDGCSTPKKLKLDSDSLDLPDGSVDSTNEYQKLKQTSTIDSGAARDVDPGQGEGVAGSLTLNSKETDQNGKSRPRVVIEYQPEDPEKIDIEHIKIERDFQIVSIVGSQEQELEPDREVMGTSMEYVEGESDSQPIETSSQIEECDPLRQTVEELVLSETKLLEKIIGALEFVELKAARLVNTTWKKMASDELLKRDCCSVVIQFDAKANTFRQSSWVEWNFGSGRFCDIPWDKPLVVLINLLKNASDFPSTSFAIANGDLSTSDIESLFEIQGTKIRQLFLKGNPKVTSKETFLKILQDSVPNLKYLEIRNFEYPWKNSDRIKMENLEVFAFYDCYKTPAAILRGSPKVEDVADPIGDYKRVKVLTDAHKISLVKRVTCDEDTKLNALTLFSNFLRSPPQLEQLKLLIDRKFSHFPTDRKIQLAATFSILLDSSKDSIEDLCLSGLFPCSDLQIPVLNKLEFLDLDWDRCPTATPCFPQGINLAETFPNVHVLDCGTLHCSRDVDWDSHFPAGSFQGNLKSVESLHVSEHCNELWMNKLQALCPNFKTLVIWGEWGLPGMLPKVYKMWAHLESMELKIYRLGRPSGGKKLFNLDAAFTGLSEKSCLELFESSEENWEWKELVQGLSVRDLKHLKRLWISFTCPQNDLVKAVRHAVPISKVSGVCAFQQMPDLKVSIWYDQNCPHTKEIEESFVSIAPFVNFSHKHEWSNNKVQPHRK